MGYNIKCTFFTDKNGNQEIISKSIIDDLKIINEEKYTVSFGNIKPTNDNITLIDKDSNENNGCVYDQNSFIQGALYYNNEVEEERKKINNLQNIINSAEYYKLNLNQRENVMEDLQCATDLIEIFETAYLCCNKMINLFEYFEHEEIINNDSDNRNTKVYCHISAI